MGGPESFPQLRAAFDGNACSDDVIAVLPVEVDVRLTVQQGAFTFHATSQSLESRTNAEQFLAKFVILASSRPVVEEELWTLGVSRAGLFPDLANLASDLAADSRRIPPRARV